MNILSNGLILISNAFWTLVVTYRFVSSIGTEPVGYIFGSLLFLILLMLMIWLPFFKSSNSKSWIIVGIIVNVRLFSLLSIIGYILKWINYNKANSKIE